KIGTPSDNVTSIDQFIKGKAEVVNKAETAPDNKVRDAYVTALEEENARLRMLTDVLRSGPTGSAEEDLTFDDFTDTAENVYVQVKDVEEIIEDLKGVEVPKYSFVLHRTGNVGVLKIHDDEGITYFVM